MIEVYGREWIRFVQEAKLSSNLKVVEIQEISLAEVLFGVPVSGSNGAISVSSLAEALFSCPVAGHEATLVPALT